MLSNKDQPQNEKINLNFTPRVPQVEGPWVEVDVTLTFQAQAARGAEYS